MTPSFMTRSPGAVHAQHGGERDAQCAVRVPRGQPHRAAGGAAAPPGEADQSGY